MFRLFGVVIFDFILGFVGFFESLEIMINFVFKNNFVEYIFY